jgi:hypothetical protein
MPASEWLEPSVVAYFIERYGGTREAAVAAMQLPGFEEEFKRQTGAALENDAEGRPYPRLLSRDTERPFWKLVEAAVGPISDAAPVRAKVEPDLTGRPLPALRALEAIKLYGEEATEYRVHQETALSRRGTKRVWTWVKGGAVWWDPVERRVRVDKRFRLVRKGEDEAATVQLVRA